VRRATDLLGDLPDLPAFLAARACQEPPEQRLMAIAGWDVWHIVRAELGDVLDWLEAAERKKRPTPAEVAKDEKAIRDMQRFGKPTKRQQQDAARLRQGKKKGGGK
jgi:hypothetical protein